MSRRDSRASASRNSLASRDIGAKDRRQADVVGDDVQHPAETLDQRIGELSLQEGWKIAALWPAGADRADERAFQSLGEPPHVPRLGLDLIRGDVDLHVQRRSGRPRPDGARAEIRD
jgi:hypothetical protein